MLPFQARVNLGMMAIKGCSAFPKASALLKPYFQIVKCHIQDSLSRLATGHSVGECKPSAEIQSVYSTAPTDWVTGHSLGESYPSAETLLVYSTAPADWVIHLFSIFFLSYYLSKFLIWSFIILVIYSIRTIVFIFIIMFTTFRPMRSSAFFRNRM